jgi:hypothetical protein
MELEKALSWYENNLAKLYEGPTGVYELKSFALKSTDDLKKALMFTDTGSAIWKHTDNYHAAAIYIKRGHGQRYSRKFMDLVAAGIDNPDKYKEYVSKQEQDLEDFLEIKSSKSSSVRQQQASYIVADLDSEPNLASKIPGKNGKVHRTHLISVKTTGIENNKGLLIDYDGWLNSKPMNEFERRILSLSNHQDIIWTTFIYKNEAGLHWRYVMLDQHFKVINQKEWIDDRWKYYWFYDPDQVED